MHLIHSFAQLQALAEVSGDTIILGSGLTQILRSLYLATPLSVSGPCNLPGALEDDDADQPDLQGPGTSL